MTIRHLLKSEETQKKSVVRSASISIIGETAYMTVIPRLPIDGKSSAAAQAREIFAIIEERLASIGSNKRKLAHVTIWLAHLHYFDEVTDAWNEWIDREHPPVRACAQVNLANKDLKVEMIVIAQV